MGVSIYICNIKMIQINLPQLFHDYSHSLLFNREDIQEVAWGYVTFAQMCFAFCFFKYYCSEIKCAYI